MKPQFKVSTDVMPSPKRFLSSGLMLVAVLMLTACVSKPLSFYTLKAPMEQAAISANTTPIFIERLTVAVPDRLARPQMVISGDNSAEIVMLEQHRWISSFDNELRDALSNGIANSIGAIDVSKTGSQPSKPAWRIAVQLRQFDLIENTRVDAAMSWTLRRADATNSVSCQWSGTEPVGQGINLLAQGAQRLTNRAALAVAHDLAALVEHNLPVTCTP
jgi:uncharacterized lipoprotein YmbA